MKPKFTQLLEKCIIDGVILGHKRAYKHDDKPSESEINQSIVNEVLNELFEWFDFDETHPQLKREWVGLTEEEKYRLFHSSIPLMALIEEVEEQLKRKNT